MMMKNTSQRVLRNEVRRQFFHTPIQGISLPLLRGGWKDGATSLVGLYPAPLPSVPLLTTPTSTSSLGYFTTSATTNITTTKAATTTTAATTATTTINTPIARPDFSSSYSNVPLHIQQRVLQTPKLYQQPSHPLHTIKEKIEDYFGPTFTVVDSLSPVVSTRANFDSLLIPPHHVSRSKSDTYYVTPDVCLRTHTSAHQVELLRQGHTSFLCTGDVYRKDDIDSSHYPIFHQMEGVKVFHQPLPHEDNEKDKDDFDDWILQDLRETLTGLAMHLFGPVEYRWVEEYFPFTHPSLELEILYQGQWLEVLGCGKMRPEILQHGGLLSSSSSSSSSLPSSKVQAWAFGLGLERLAMVLFEIPDIRLFWSQDERFWNQFQPGKITKFQPYSKYPPCYKDVSFWILEPTLFHVNDLLDVTRQIVGDLVEHVELVDTFAHPKNPDQVSHCYRITYRSMDRSLTNMEIDVLQDQLRAAMALQLPVRLR